MLVVYGEMDFSELSAKWRWIPSLPTSRISPLDITFTIPCLQPQETYRESEPLLRTYPQAPSRDLVG